MKSFKRTLMDNDDSEDKSSTWNMGVYFYLGLYKIKEDMSQCLINKQWVQALLLLIEEVDWVGGDISDDVRKDLIIRTNNLLELILNKSRGGELLFLQGFIKARRLLWDEELRCDITRPGRGVDKSNIPISIINNR